MPWLLTISCLSLAAFCMATAPQALAQSDATHPFTVHDMLAMDRIGDPQVAPDESRIVFTRRVTDIEANRGRTQLWMIDIDGSNLRPLTAAESSSYHPRWSPDGQFIYFLSGRGDHTQVHRLPLAGGESAAVTDFPIDVSAFAINPDGKHLAVAMDVFADLSTPADTRKRLDDIKAQKTTGRVYDRLFVRHWDQWKDGRRSHLFVVPVDGGAAVDCMAGMDADCPTKPFGGSEEFTFSPDGSRLVFCARDAGRTEAWSTDIDLYESPISGGVAPRCLTVQNEAWDTLPVFSPDGKTLAYLAMSTPGYESDRRRIVLLDESGRKRSLAQDWDRSPSDLLWSRDGKTIYAVAQHVGQRALFAIDVDTGKVRTIHDQGHVGSPRLAGQRLIIGRDDLRGPVELYSLAADGSDVRRITRINDKRLAKARLGDTEQFTFRGWNNETVHAYLVKPVDFDPARKYPLAFLIHGGPQGSFGNHFHYRWNPQAYAGAGYAAVMIDFHGSTGYGQSFCDAINNDWGGKPLIDLQKGLAAALERYPWIDGDRVGALGASFGGFMINWIAGQWPDRFRCLVCHDGNLDERMAYYDTEELWFPEYDHGGTPWENPGGYSKHNPIDYVDQWKTPMLVIHGALDYRVVDTQGLSTFTALQRRGIPSKLLYYPDENHWVLQPANSVQWHETVLSWLDEWTR